jgi:CBS domain containing-hemolysin-like protein
MFSSIAADTLVHVHMNYAPPMRFLRPVLSPFTGELEGHIERALRQFKESMEKKEQNTMRAESATGTYGPELLTSTQKTRFGGPSTPEQSVRPPEAKS